MAAVAIFRLKVGMIPTLVGCCLAGVVLDLAGVLATAPADVRWKKVDQVFARQAAVSGTVHRYGLPRGDLKVSLDDPVLIADADAGK